MKRYRIYCFDVGSKIVSTDWIEAVNDAEAIVVAKKPMDCFTVEIWDGERRVGRYSLSEV